MLVVEQSVGEVARFGEADARPHIRRFATPVGFLAVDALADPVEGVTAAAAERFLQAVAGSVEGSRLLGRVARCRVLRSATTPRASSVGVGDVVVAFVGVRCVTGPPLVIHIAIQPKKLTSSVNATVSVRDSD